MNIKMQSCVVLLVMGSMVGCAKKEPEQAFFPPVHGQATMAILDAQAQAGARADATLYGQHFDGESINSLGREKLALILMDSQPRTTIYLDVPEAARRAERMKAVQTHLSDAGFPADSITVEAGANPGNWHASAESIKRMPKTNTSSDDSTEMTPLSLPPRGSN